MILWRVEVQFSQGRYCSSALPSVSQSSGVLLAAFFAERGLFFAGPSWRGNFLTPSRRRGGSPLIEKRRWYID